MKCIILCAGYATRLYPLTKETPKPLLKIRGKTILDHILDRMPLKIIDHIYIVSNDKFYHNFVDWSEQLDRDVAVTVINDHTKSNDDRLGSIGDLHYIVQSTGLEDDFIMINGDNLFNFNIQPLIEIFRTGKNVVALYDVKSLAEASKMGVPTVNSEGIITHLVEKPKKPEKTVVSIGVYCFLKSVIALLQQYVAEGKSVDKVGEFLEWLCYQTNIHTFIFSGSDDIWLDIGTPDQLELAKQLFNDYE